MTGIPIALAERGALPDAWIRCGIRRLLRRRLEAMPPTGAAEDAYLEGFERRARESEIAIETEAANQQHYNVPPAFYACMLGPRRKYSSAYYPDADSTLAEAEEAMLRLSCERAGLADGQRILELGCGWGSLSIWMAEHFPEATIEAVSNAAEQIAYVRHQAAERGLANLEARVADINRFEPAGPVDRVVSVEMFEHLRNHARLFRRIAEWLRPSGRLFVHVFGHRRVPYFFEDAGAGSWMARNFFTGGMMPSRGWFQRVCAPLHASEPVWIDGTHYARTLEDWLGRLDDHRTEALGVLGQGLPAAEARRRLQRWRMFLMACSESFAWNGGTEWGVLHQVFTPRPQSS